MHFQPYKFNDSAALNVKTPLTFLASQCEIFTEEVRNARKIYRQSHKEIIKKCWGNKNEMSEKLKDLLKLYNFNELYYFKLKKD